MNKIRKPRDRIICLCMIKVIIISAGLLLWSPLAKGQGLKPKPDSVTNQGQGEQNLEEESHTLGGQGLGSQGLGSQGLGSQGKIIYKPPLRGKPRNRVAGGTRAPDQETPHLMALVPDHLALTMDSRPRLYWYISKSTSHHLEFSLSDEQGIEPLIETTLASPKQEGIYCIHLADYGVSLEPQREYQWFIALVINPAARSLDQVTSGSIKLMVPSPALEKKVTELSPSQSPAFLAKTGFWYDALATLSQMIEVNPEDQKLRQMRADLLDQAGLSEVADYERGKASW